MAGRIAYYGNIVTQGLVLDLDAAKRESYPGTGTSWNDISSNGFTGTLTNGPIYSSDNYGSFIFDGVDDYVNSIGTTSTFSFIQNTAVFTINAWVKPSLLGTAMYFMGNNNGTTTAKGFFLGKLASNSLWFDSTYGVGGQNGINFQVSGYFTDTNWVNVTVTSNRTNLSAYKNGSLSSSSGTVITLSTGDSTTVLGIGQINNMNTSYWNGNISQVQIYNRTLSQAEVTQNFNAYRTRYGI